MGTPPAAGSLVSVFRKARSAAFSAWLRSSGLIAGDRLGRLALSEEGLARRDVLVAGLATARGLPLASTVGGGYGDDVLAIARRHVAVIVRLEEALSQ